jgi:hypothetical protein
LDVPDTSEQAPDLREQEFQQPAVLHQ